MIEMLAAVLTFCVGYVVGVVSVRRSARRGRLQVVVIDGAEGPLTAVSDDGVVNMEIVDPPPRCPDGGRCHHRCQNRCWRVDNCGPLSGVFPEDRWPDATREAAR